MLHGALVGVVGVLYYAVVKLSTKWNVSGCHDFVKVLLEVK